MNLQITSAGLAALAAAAETRTVRITRVAVGEGRGPGGPADAGRTALRTERDSAPAAAATPAAGPRLAIRAHVLPAAASYAVSEVGVFARATLAGGVPGDEVLLAYWTDPAATLTHAVSGAAIAVAALVDLRNAGAGAVAAALEADLAIAVPQAFTDLADTPAHVPGNLLRIAPAGDAVDSVTVAAAAAQILAAAPPALRTFTADATLTAPDHPCRWLVAAWGAGAGGPAQTPDPRRPPTDGGATRMLIGRATTSADLAAHIAGGGDPADLLVVQAAGGRADGSRASYGDGETWGQFRLRNAGPAGGRGYYGADVGGQAARGNNGDLAISLFTPTPAQTFALTIAAAGRGGQSSEQDGQNGRLAILELR